MAINEEIYKKAAVNVKEMELRSISLQDLIDTLKDVGTDTTEMQAKAQELSKQITRWRSVLTEKGYMDAV